MRKKENRDEKNDREDAAYLHLQLHEGRLPLPSLYLQKLQLLSTAARMNKMAKAR